MFTKNLKKLSNILMLSGALLTGSTYAQQDSKDATGKSPDGKAMDSKTVGLKDFTGLSVSPSTLHFNLNPGETKSMEVKLTNDTKKPYTFQANFSDFIMGANGKPIGQKAGENEFGLSKWTSFSPSYFEIAPGETQKIIVTVTVPPGEVSNHAAWTVMMLDEVTKRAPMSTKGTANTIGLGITPTVGFGVYIYQNPPTLRGDDVAIQQFSYTDSLSKSQLRMKTLNNGKGIGFCTSYVELTNLKTGKMDKLKVQKFTILPGFNRMFVYDLPSTLEKGKYSAVGVVDTNNPDQVTAAELEFTKE